MAGFLVFLIVIFTISVTLAEQRKYIAGIFLILCSRPRFTLNFNSIYSGSYLGFRWGVFQIRMRNISKK